MRNDRISVGAFVSTLITNGLVKVQATSIYGAALMRTNVLDIRKIALTSNLVK